MNDWVWVSFPVLYPMYPGIWGSFGIDYKEVSVSVFLNFIYWDVFSVSNALWHHVKKFCTLHSKCVISIFYGCLFVSKFNNFLFIFNGASIYIQQGFYLYLTGFLFIFNRVFIYIQRSFYLYSTEFLFIFNRVSFIFNRVSFMFNESLFLFSEWLVFLTN